MNSALKTTMGFVLGVLLVTGCGDSDAVPGFNGQTICASDNSDVGQTIDCPSGEETIDFCVNTSSGNCYYVIGGDQIDCGNCLDGGGFINTCAQEAIDRCN
jgi:hypothetical protein